MPTESMKLTRARSTVIAVTLGGTVAARLVVTMSRTWWALSASISPAGWIRSLPSASTRTAIAIADITPPVGPSRRAAGVSQVKPVTFYHIRARRHVLDLGKINKVTVATK